MKKTANEFKKEISDIRDELEGRHASGLQKTASDTSGLSTEELQSKMYKLIYKLSQALKESPL
jgi:hypothetical protein